MEIALLPFLFILNIPTVKHHTHRPRTFQHCYCYTSKSANWLETESNHRQNQPRWTLNHFYSYYTIIYQFSLHRLYTRFKFIPHNRTHTPRKVLFINVHSHPLLWPSLTEQHAYKYTYRYVYVKIWKDQQRGCAARK